MKSSGSEPGLKVGTHEGTGRRDWSPILLTRRNESRGPVLWRVHTRGPVSKQDSSIYMTYMKNRTKKNITLWRWKKKFSTEKPNLLNCWSLKAFIISRTGHHLWARSWHKLYSRWNYDSVRNFIHAYIHFTCCFFKMKCGVLYTPKKQLLHYFIKTCKAAFEYSPG